MSAVSIFFNVLAIIGAALLLFGFYRVTSGRWSNRSFWYELDNLLGAILVAAYQIYYHAYITVVINLIWAGVAFWGLAIFLKRAHNHRKRHIAEKADR